MGKQAIILKHNYAIMVLEMILKVLGEGVSIPAWLMVKAFQSL